jgi:hypothetical protein
VTHHKVPDLRYQNKDSCSPNASWQLKMLFHTEVNCADSGLASKKLLPVFCFKIVLYKGNKNILLSHIIEITT